MTEKSESTQPMTKEEALAYMAGYEAVNALEIEELRAMSISEKFEHAAALMESASRLGLTEALSAEDAEARRLWIRLKRAYSGGG